MRFLPRLLAIIWFGLLALCFFAYGLWIAPKWAAVLVIALSWQSVTLWLRDTAPKALKDEMKRFQPAIRSEEEDRTEDLSAEYWKDIAERHCRNEDYYRSVIDECAAAIGPEAYLCDDGSISEDALAAKLPSLVRKLKGREAK